MKDYSKTCTGCFTEKGDLQTCPNCGYDEGKEKNTVALTPRSLLDDQYLSGRMLGKPGGFGITYFGWDTRLETTIAIKEYLPRQHAGRGKDGTTVTPHSEEDKKTFEFGMQQFLQEARNLAKFNHPSIVRVRHFFEANDTAYLVMDYLDGCNLHEHVKRNGGKLPESEATHIILQILDGLKVVHAANTYHRDIKPQNIYITKDGRAILLDFGAARVAVGDQTQSMSVIITPGFAPYEQYNRRSLQGPWTDVYACAATLYYTVTGKSLPDSIEAAHEEKPIIHLAEGSELLSRQLFKTLETALASEPENRPQSAEAFAEMLKNPQSSQLSDDDQPTVILDDQSTVILKNTSNQTADDLAKPPKSKPQKMKFAIGGVVTLLVISAFFFWQRMSEKQIQTTESELPILTADQVTSKDEFLAASKEELSSKESSENVLYHYFIQKGDSLYQLQKFELAKDAYQQALETAPGDSIAQVAIKNCDGSVEQLMAKTRRDQIAELKTAGNRQFNRGQTTKALGSYAAALKLAPKDTYILQQIEYCKTMIFIPAGEFTMGSKAYDDTPVHKVNLSAFYMDKVEVTVQQYERFVKSANYSQPLNWQEQLKNPQNPVVGASWSDTNAFAKWAKKRLPTEAEWEYAARGGLQGKSYPWGNSAPTELKEYKTRFALKNIDVRQTGLFEPNGYGLFDMADNAWEWCSDWYGFNSYQQGGSSNPRGPATGQRRVVRGIAGPENFTKYNFRCAARFAEEPEAEKKNIGFRCVLDLKIKK